MEEDRLTVDMFCFDDTISVNFKPMERPKVRLNASVEEAHVQVTYVHPSDIQHYSHDALV